MATMPLWADTPGRAQISEPFRSDADFWVAIAASADAVVALAVSAGGAAALTVVGGGLLPLLVFVVPLPWFVRASLAGSASSARTRQQFADHRSWRDAERQAVARIFLTALRRRRF